jgi:hypothetical protein
MKTIFSILVLFALFSWPVQGMNDISEEMQAYAESLLSPVEDVFEVIFTHDVTDLGVTTILPVDYVFADKEQTKIEGRSIDLGVAVAKHFPGQVKSITVLLMDKKGTNISRFTLAAPGY